MFCLFGFCCNFKVWKSLNSGLEQTILRVTKVNPLPGQPHFHRNPLYLLQVYKAINIYVALIGLEIWSDGDKCLLSQGAGFTLDSFSKWRLSDLLRRKRHDNAQLITCVSFALLCAFPDLVKKLVPRKQ